MRALRIPLIVFGLVVALPLGAAVLYVALQFHDVLERTELTPHLIAAAELSENGPPKNLHIELTDFKFGEPVIERNKDGWESVWLPIKPSPASKVAGKRLLFLRVDVPDQAALDEFVGRANLTALVASPLPKNSRWRVTAGKALRKAYPKLDTSHVVYLAEPKLDMSGISLDLADGRLYDPTIHSLVAWSGAGLLFFGILSLGLLSSRFASEPARRKPVHNAEELRGQLSTERSVSVHQSSGFQILLQVVSYAGLAVVLLAAAVGFAFAVVQIQAQGRPLIAILCAFISLPLFVASWASARTSRHRWHWPREVAVCHSGLRWRQPRGSHDILWSEVVEAKREIRYVRNTNGGLAGAFADLNNPNGGNCVDTLRITLDTGESYTFAPIMLDGYADFAANIGKIWSDHQKNADLTGVTEAWLKARSFGVPAPSKDAADATKSTHRAPSLPLTASQKRSSN